MSEVNLLCSLSDDVFSYVDLFFLMMCDLVGSVITCDFKLSGVNLS
jgi:hypothetical protein